MEQKVAIMKAETPSCGVVCTSAETASTVGVLADIPFIFVFLLMVWSIAGSVVWVLIAGGILMVVPGFFLQKKMIKLTREITRERTSFSTPLSSADFLERLGYKRDTTLDSVVMSVFLGGEKELFNALMPALKQGGTNDKKLAKALESIQALDASALILIHNHPSGDPTPSRADIEMTKTINEIASSLGITVHDHIIIDLDRAESHHRYPG